MLKKNFESYFLMMLKASVIIPTRNRANTLSLCLESVLEQTISRDAFEILVVDNGSTDHTRSVVEGFDNELNLQYIYAPAPGLHVGRHAGLMAASSDILVFADDDIVAAPTWIDGIVKSFKEPDVVLVGGNNFPKFESPPPEWLLKLWRRPVYKGRALSALSVIDFGDGMFDVDPAYVWGCNFSVRRSFLLECNGFHPDGVPDDLLKYRGDGETHISDMVQVLGKRALFNSDASVQHYVSEGRMTKSYMCKRAYIHGISDSYTYIRRFGIDDSMLSLLKLFIKKWFSLVIRVIKAFLLPSSKVERELRIILFLSKLEYWKGFYFHQREVKNDPELLVWIRKDNYL